MPRDKRGVESLPMALLLGTMLAASTVAIGAACLERAERMSERQRMIDSFNAFVERAQFLSAGGVGSIQAVDLDLGGGWIRVEGKCVQLLNDNSVLRGELVPLEISVEGNLLRSGSYIMRVVRDSDGSFFLAVEGA